MAAKKKTGFMQDVYHITYCDVALYIKLQVNILALVVSFKEQD